VVARGCHGTSAPRHASSRAGRPPASAAEGGRSGGAGGVPEHGGEGGESLAAGGARRGRQKGWRSNQSGGGVDQAAYRLGLVAASGATGASGRRRGRRQGRLEREGRRRPEASVGLTDRSAKPSWSGLDQRADQAEVGRPGEMGFGLFSLLESA
jgi:hypothetical protein